jgi:hypothetical protein
MFAARSPQRLCLDLLCSGLNPCDKCLTILLDVIIAKSFGAIVRTDVRANAILTFLKESGNEDFAANIEQTFEIEGPLLGLTEPEGKIFWQAFLDQRRRTIAALVKRFAILSAAAEAEERARNQEIAERTDVGTCSHCGATSAKIKECAGNKHGGTHNFVKPDDDEGRVLPPPPVGEVLGTVVPDAVKKDMEVIGAQAVLDTLTQELTGKAPSSKKGKPIATPNGSNHSINQEESS